MIEGFKKFIARGNMIDMAVGVVMGGAVTTVVNAIVDSVINPFIAMIFGKPNMDGLLAITFNGATVSFGAVLGAILNFLIIAVAVYFCILVPINKFRDVTEAPAGQDQACRRQEGRRRGCRRNDRRRADGATASADSRRTRQAKRGSYLTIDRPSPPQTTPKRVPIQVPDTANPATFVAMPVVGEKQRKTLGIQGLMSGR